MMAKADDVGQLVTRQTEESARVVNRIAAQSGRAQYRVGEGDTQRRAVRPSDAAFGEFQAFDRPEQPRLLLENLCPTRKTLAPGHSFVQPGYRSGGRGAFNLLSCSIVHRDPPSIGRASCRERVCQYV